MSLAEIVLLQRHGVTVTNLAVSTPRASLAMGLVRGVGVATSRPGFVGGAGLCLLGVLVVSRAPSLLKVLGVLLVIFGLARARIERHRVIALVDGGERVLFETADRAFAGEVARAIERAMSPSR